MKIQNRVIYTSILVVCCVLFAWPNTTGIVCDGQQTKAAYIISTAPEILPEAAVIEEIQPLQNLLPSCNLFIH